MKRGQAGFTLVELMVGIALLAALSLAMAGTYLVGYRAINTETSTISADTASSNAIMWLTRDLNSADTIPTGTPIDATHSVTLTSGSGATSVTYTVDANRDLIRSTGGTSQPVSRGITSVALNWSGCYGTVTIQPSASGAAAVVLNVSNRPHGCF